MYEVTMLQVVAGRLRVSGAQHVNCIRPAGVDGAARLLATGVIVWVHPGDVAAVAERLGLEVVQAWEGVTA